MHIFKNQITNENSIIQDKANYFADCFDFTLTHMGSYGFPTLETQNSLLRKIRFQLMHYQANHSKKYILYYANNPLLNQDDRMIRDYYKHIIPFIKLLRNGKYTEISVRESLIKTTDKTIAEMSCSLIKNAVDEIQQILHCPENLEVHGHDHLDVIDYATAVIIAELRFKGHPKKDIENLFERLLTSEVKVIQDKVITEFPLPQHLVEIKGKDENNRRIGEIESFMESRSLREQFDGIYNLYLKKPMNKVLFKVIRTKSKQPINKTYGNVRLTTQIKPFILKKMNDEYREFVSSKDQLYIEVTLPVESLDSAEMLAIEMVNRELPKLDLFFGVKLVIDFNFMAIKIDDVIHFKSRYTSNWIRNNKETKNLIERKLSKIQSPAASEFSYLEGIYAHAKTSQLPDMQLNHYWRYIESSFSALGLNSEAMRRILSNILSNAMTNNVWFSYYQIANDILANNRNGFKTVNNTISYREIMDFLNETMDAKWICKANNYVNHPYLTGRIEALGTVPIKQLHQNMSCYYENILRETYEQRNFIQHSGVYEPEALDKVMIVLPEIVMIFRELVLSKILKNKLKTYPEIIRELQKMPLNLSRLIKKNSLSSAL